jgi:hypothetical protein
MPSEKKIGGVQRHDVRGSAAHVVVGARIPQEPRDELLATLGLAGYFAQLIPECDPAGKTVFERECALYVTEPWRGWCSGQNAL